MAVIIAAALTAGFVHAGEAATSANTARSPRSLAALPVNTWIEVNQSGDGKWLSSIWYMPATDEFISWGKYGWDRPPSIYDIRTFKVGDKGWRDSFPLGKEEAWAGRKWPNWNVRGYWSRMKSWKGPQPKNVYDSCVAGYAARNSVSFVKTEGVLRPTRSPTFHQGCWDSKRERMIYFVGGKTFSYDPVKRIWTNLNPSASPAWCQHLVWASLCYDEHNDEVMLFGGGMAMNAWGGARTWIYDCGKNTWRRPEFGTPELKKLRARLEETTGRLRDTRCRAEYELGQVSGVRKAAVGAALAELKKLGGELGALAGSVKSVKAVEAEKLLAGLAGRAGKTAGTPASDKAHELVVTLRKMESELDRAYRSVRAEPPMRCNSQLVYDKKNKLIVLFGGDAQNAKLCDTWVYDVHTRTWRERYPRVSPPPNDVVTATYVDKNGVIVAAGFPAGRDTYVAWMYDAGKNEWTPLKGTYKPKYVRWHSIAYSVKDDLLLVNCVYTKPSGTRWDFAYRLDPATAGDSRKGVTDSARPRYHYDFDAKAMAMPAPDSEVHVKELARLPANQWVQMPGPHVSRKTWGSATIDTDRGIILYYGGGHSGYSGTDVAHYDMGAGRWTQSYPAEFPPFLRGTSRTVYGWSYNLHPWAEHTRKWYAYDPVSKMVVYARQGSIRKGNRLHIGVGADGAVTATGVSTWIYNPRLRKWYPPTCDRPFGTGDADHLISTPDGVYAHTSRSGLWHCTVERVEENGKARYVARWKQVIKKVPGGGYDLSGTTVYDSKRRRLVSLAGGRKGGRMIFIDPASGKVEKASPEGKWNCMREVCYIPDQDVIFTPAGYQRKGYYVYRCAENKWVQVDIAAPMIGGKPINRGKGASADTVILYDPRHKVLFHFDVGNTVHLMRYDDKSVKVRD